MWLTRQEGIPQTSRMGPKFQRPRTGVSALLLVFIVTSLAAVLIACGGDPSPTPQPTATAAAVATSTPEPTPTPVATMAPEPTSTPMPTPSPVATAAPEPTIAPMPTPAPTATAAPEPTPAPPEATAEPAPLDDDDALTRAFVEKAIEYYGENGLDATIELYRSESSEENGRSLILFDEAESTLLVYRNIPALEGQYIGPGSRFSGFAQLIGVATEEGFWVSTRGINPATKQEEPRRILVVLHDGLVFSSAAIRSWYRTLRLP